MIKTIYVIVFFILSVNTTAQPISRPAFYKNIQYMASFWITNYRGELRDFIDNYIVKIIFNIDTLGCVINYRVVDKVVAVPDTIEKYALNQILKTSGYWFPEVKENTPIMSADITVFFWISTRPREPASQNFDDIKEWKVFSPNNYDTSVDNMYETNHYSFFIELPRLQASAGMTW